MIACDCLHLGQSQLCRRPLQRVVAVKDCRASRLFQRDVLFASVRIGHAEHQRHLRIVDLFGLWRDLGDQLFERRLRRCGLAGGVLCDAKQ